ncbi:MAG TPA: sigma-70 family RNA polymerase sigma factor [Longimicrobiales bacterium]|nr:sigma-70 family RNA polymerase sigma factor [Longimicrobiales bacterium]
MWELIDSATADAELDPKTTGAPHTIERDPRMDHPPLVSAPPLPVPGTPPAPADFQGLVVSVLPSAFGYALRLTRNRADAEDLVQDAVLRAVRGEHTFEPGTNFKAWFFRILLRCFWSRHRKQRRSPSTMDFDDTPDLYLYARAAEAGLQRDGEDPAGALFQQLGTERVADAIAQLPEEYGVVCTLYFMEDFAYQEIADVLEVPVGTVRSRLHRGRKMLQKSLWRVAVDAGIIADPAEGA